MNMTVMATCYNLISMLVYSIGTVYVGRVLLKKSKYVKYMATIEKYVIWNEAEDYCHVEIQIPVKLKKS